MSIVAAPTSPTEITFSPALQAALAGIAAEIESELERRLDEAPLPDNLRQAIRYAALGPGKRARPALTMLCCGAVGGDRQRALAPACAMELIHCFSLVHDDLPAMDDDQVRRGRPTLHVHAGEAMAILAGDAMVSIAFEWLAQAEVGPSQRVMLVRELAAATTAMIAGQVYDTLGGFPPHLTERAKLDLIHRSKTAALITAACRMGAICAACPDSLVRSISRYGEALGLMFQIVDDLLDVTQSAEHVGKAVGKDVDAGKLTFPGLIGVEASKAEVERLRAEAHAALDSLGGANENARLLLDLADAMAIRTK